MDLSTREGRREQGNRIKRAAEQAGIGLEELARRIDCSRALIYQYTSGMSLVQTDRLQQISQILGKPLVWFFLEEGAALPPPSDVPPRPASSAAVLPAVSSLPVSALSPAPQAESAAIRSEVRRLQMLREAYASPQDWRRLADTCQQLVPLLQIQTDASGAGEALLAQGNALIQLNDWKGASERLEQAQSLFEEIGRTARALDCRQSLGHVSMMQGDMKAAMAQFQVVAASEDWWNRWQGALSIGTVHEAMGEIETAVEAFERALDVVEERHGQADTEQATLYIEANWASVELACGDFTASAQRAARCRNLALRLHAQDQYIEALLTAGLGMLPFARTTDAFTVLELARDLAELKGDRARGSLALSALAQCYTAQAQPEIAGNIGKEALILALQSGAHRSELAAHRALAAAYLSTNAVQEAIYHIEKGTALAVRSGLRLEQAWCELLLGQAQLAQNSVGGAIERVGAALAVAHERGARALEFECGLVLTRALLAARDFPQARQRAAETAALAGSIELTQWVWIGSALDAIAASESSDQDTMAPSFQAAIAEIEVARARDGRDTLMDDPIARDLLHAWILFVLRTGGSEEADRQVLALEWPPLDAWWAQTKRMEGDRNDA